MKKTFFFLALLLMVMISVGSCQQESKDVQPTFSDYLSINHEINYSKLSKSEQQIIYEAFKRLTFVETGYGMMEIKQRSGAEVNISENIYNFFDKIVRGTNLKTRALEDSCGDGGRGKDCVIQSIYGILKDMGITDISTGDIEKKLDEHGYYWGDDLGTFRSSISGALKLFFTVTPIGESTYSDKSYTIQPNEGHYFVVQNTSNGFHAETVLWSYGGCFVCRDDQATARVDSGTVCNTFFTGDVDQLYKLELQQP